MSRILVVLAMPLSVQAAESPASPRHINILAGDTSGAYYRLGVALSGIYRKAMPHASVSVQSTHGSVENLKLLQNGRAEVAFAIGSVVSYAWSGNRDVGFNAPHKKLRAIANLYPNHVQIVVLETAGIKTLDELKGKRIAVNVCHVGAEISARNILLAAGIAEEEVGRIECLSFPDSVRLMRRGEVDAIFRSAGLGLASLRELATQEKVRFLPISADVARRMGNAVYQPGVIPAKTYPGQIEDVPTITIASMLVTHEDMPEGAVYSMTLSLYGDRDRLVAAEPLARAVKPTNVLIGLPVPLHPGAERYYREKGLLK